MSVVRCLCGATADVQLSIEGMKMPVSTISWTCNDPYWATETGKIDHIHENWIEIGLVDDGIIFDLVVKCPDEPQLFGNTCTQVDRATLEKIRDLINTVLETAPVG